MLENLNIWERNEKLDDSWTIPKSRQVEAWVVNVLGWWAHLVKTSFAQYLTPSKKSQECNIFTRFFPDVFTPFNSCFNKN